jgi:hypothetical protein
MRLEVLPNRLVESTFLRGICQAENFLGDHSIADIASQRIGRLAQTRSRIRRALEQRGAAKAPPRPQKHLGEPSKFAVGSWVRVLDEDRLRKTLDARYATGGLVFCHQQWAYCKGVFRVKQHVRRILDDRGHMRPVSRTVNLEGVDCCGIGGGEGCGRYCPLMFRDAWLEPTEAPKPVEALGQLLYARIRSRDEIEATLDARGRLDGLVFMPEMYAHVGRRVRVHARVSVVRELGRWVYVPEPVFVLEGLSCSGGIFGAEGPCDRGCSLLWHIKWLELELPWGVVQDVVKRDQGAGL